MAKNIVLLSDGTGNGSGKLFKTNVWRLFQLLDLRDPSKQVACYDNGVGTSSFRPLAILAEVFGFGLKRNVIDLYSFCCRNWEQGDRISCFGFSRGAFTMRIVAGLIIHHGLVDYKGNDQELARYAADAYRDYRRRFRVGAGTAGFVSIARGLRDAGLWIWRTMWRNPTSDPNPKQLVDSIHFMGLWDTVDAYGGPIEEVTRAIDYWVWPLSMPDKFINARVHRACHALALDDERDAFRPVIWDERYVRGGDPQHPGKEYLYDINYHAPSHSGRELETPPHLRNDLTPVDRERISQVWFAGVHADVGGGYPQDGLSFFSLDWMIDRATAYGLIVLAEPRRVLATPQVNLRDLLNDSRAGVAGYYRYRPRNITDIYDAPVYKPSVYRDIKHIIELILGVPASRSEIKRNLHPSTPPEVQKPALPTIHQAVFDRIASGTDAYAPVVLPKDYMITDKAGALTVGPAAVDQQPFRYAVQDEAWDWIWVRRVVYFLTVFASTFIAFIPFFVIYWPGFGVDLVGSFVKPVINAAASFLPSLLTPWFDAFRDAPGFLLAGVIAVVILLYLGTQLQVLIRDMMRLAWQPTGTTREAAGWHGFVFWLRHCGVYRAFFYILKNWIFPTAILFWLLPWLAFGTANTLGLICKGKVLTDVTDWEITSLKTFETSKLCNPTGLKVTAGETYRIELEADLTKPFADGSMPTSATPWSDGSIKTDPNGFSWDRMHSAQYPGFPYKRLIWSNWFATILRVGGSGLEEHLLRLNYEPSQGRPVVAAQTQTTAPGAPPPPKMVWATKFRARSDGEVFLYVNDTAVFLPWALDYFYKRNNQGSAKVTLRKEPTAD